MKILAKVFQIVVVLIGIGALTFMLWEPHLEGRNAHATTFQIYFNDPFLAFAYIASIPFFMALFHGFKALGFAGQNKASSPAALKSLRTIKRCAIAMIGFAVVGELIIMFGSSDDRAGGIAMGALITLCAIALAFTATKFERTLQQKFIS